MQTRSMKYFYEVQVQLATCYKLQASIATSTSFLCLWIILNTNTNANYKL